MHAKDNTVFPATVNSMYLISEFFPFLKFNGPGEISILNNFLAANRNIKSK